MYNRILRIKVLILLARLMSKHVINVGGVIETMLFGVVDVIGEVTVTAAFLNGMEKFTHTEFRHGNIQFLA